MTKDECFSAEKSWQREAIRTEEKQYSLVKTTKGKLEMKRKLGFQSQEFAVDKFPFGGLSMEAKVNSMLTRKTADYERWYTNFSGPPHFASMKIVAYRPLFSKCRRNTKNRGYTHTFSSAHPLQFTTGSWRPMYEFHGPWLRKCENRDIFLNVTSDTYTSEINKNRQILYKKFR